MFSCRIESKPAPCMGIRQAFDKFPVYLTKQLHLHQYSILPYSAQCLNFSAVPSVFFGQQTKNSSAAKITSRRCYFLYSFTANPERNAGHTCPFKLSFILLTGILREGRRIFHLNLINLFGFFAYQYFIRIDPAVSGLDIVIDIRGTVFLLKLHAGNRRFQIRL